MTPEEQKDEFTKRCLALHRSFRPLFKDEPSPRVWTSVFLTFMVEFIKNEPEDKQKLALESVINVLREEFPDVN